MRGHVDPQSHMFSYFSPEQRVPSFDAATFSENRERLASEDVAQKIWLVTFMNYDLGFFDHETGRAGDRIPNPNADDVCEK
jgi:hypothetical protein